MHGQAGLGLDKAALLLEEPTALYGPVDTGKWPAIQEQVDLIVGRRIQVLSARDCEILTQLGHGHACFSINCFLTRMGRSNAATNTPISRGSHAGNLSVGGFSTVQPPRALGALPRGGSKENLLNIPACLASRPWSP